MRVQASLFFPGNCEQAIALCGKAIGAELEMLVRYRDSPDPLPGMVPPGFDDKVTHASVRIGASVVMMSDDCSGPAGFRGFVALAGRCCRGGARRRGAGGRRSGADAARPDLLVAGLRHAGRPYQFGVGSMVNVTGGIPAGAS